MRTHCVYVLQYQNNGTRIFCMRTCGCGAVCDNKVNRTLSAGTFLLSRTLDVDALNQNLIAVNYFL